MPRLFQQLQQTITQRGLAPSGSLLLLCVSGGCDSVALLRLLAGLKALNRWQLYVLHFNHRLRPEADEEAGFVRDLALEHELPFTLKSAGHLSPEQPGLQARAREWRRSESLKLMKSLDADRIVTAHHADDQAETWLLKWLRGAHLSGLQGMQWMDPPFIRPLLGVSKRELRDFLLEYNWSWMEDPTNLDPKYMRNRVRAELVPLLNELSRGGLDSRLSDLHDQSQLLSEFLDHIYREWEAKGRLDSEHHTINLRGWDAEPALLRGEILHRFITGVTGESLPYRQVRSIIELLEKGGPHWKQDIPGSWVVVRKRDLLMCIPQTHSP